MARAAASKRRPSTRFSVLLLATAVVLLAAGLSLVASGRLDRHTAAALDARRDSAAPAAAPTSMGPATARVPASTVSPSPSPATTAPATTTTTVAPSPYSGATVIGPVTLTGCPPSRKPPPLVPPSHPSVLVPESSLPTPPAAAPRVTNLSALGGKGMWIWQRTLTSGGSVPAIVAQAQRAGLGQVWVRVGDSFDGFYGQSFLNLLVPALHRAGVAVIGWGFPYLYDPVGDAAWTKQAMAWRAPDGTALNGWAADIETASEGTALSARRSSTYLGLVRPAMAGRPLVATVFPPTTYWLGHYPYQAMVPYIDAFAPMMYWSCTEPGADAALALHALAALAPVHLIGQAYDMGPYGGRDGPPSGPEIARFLDVARRGGAVGASFWVWQDMTAPEWAALGSYRWSP